MTQEKFDAIVQRLAAEARRHPRIYVVKVALLAAAGYAYLGVVFLVSTVLLVGLVALAISGKGLVLVVKGGWLLLLFVWAILRAMWVRLPVPEGRRLQRQDAPALFAVLDDFRAKLGAPAFHEVVVNHDFNAAVVQVPRLGIFGWHRNYLLLGLPFLEAMPVEEFKAVIAHEYGHLASGHAAFNNWIYRQRMTWHRVVAQMGAQGQGGILILPFLKRYVPFFNAYSFVLARDNEYAADRASVTLVGAPVVARALLRAEVVGQYLAERVYPSFYQQAVHTPVPAAPLSRFLRERLSEGPSTGDSSRWVVRASSRRTDSGDTHPAFSDRVGAIRQRAELDGAPGPTAAEALLGGALTGELHAAADQAWEKANRTGWQERFDQAEKARARLAEMEGQMDWTHPKPAEVWERATLVEELRSAEEALPLYLEVQKRDPKHIGAALAAGRIMLKRGDAGGVAQLEQAMQLDWRATIPACDLIYGYHLDHGDEAAAQAVLRRYRDHQDRLHEAEDERARLERSTKCEPHGLGSAELQQALEMLQLETRVARAWLVRKRVVHFPDAPLFILAVKVPWWHIHFSDAYAQLVGRLAERVKLPGQTYVVSLDSGFSWIAKRMQATPGSLIYERK